MLKNILALRERRVDDVMVPRADIIAVQQRHPLGELIKVFEGAGHSRLVVYNETLDDPVGMVHIRDLIGFMCARARPSAKSKPSARSRSRPGSISRRSILSMPLVGGEDHPPDPVRAALDAGDRSAGQDAGDAHPSGAGDRRIWRHRRHRVDRGHRRADRRRHRGRARRGRNAAWCASPTARSSPMRARQLEDVVATVGTEFDVGEVASEVDTLGGYIMTRAGRAARARRGRAGPGQFRDRGARRRSAPGQAVAHPPARKRSPRAGREREARRPADGSARRSRMRSRDASVTTPPGNAGSAASARQP